MQIRKLVQIKIEENMDNLIGKGNDACSSCMKPQFY